MNKWASQCAAGVCQGAIAAHWGDSPNTIGYENMANDFNMKD